MKQHRAPPFVSTCFYRLKADVRFDGLDCLVLLRSTIKITVVGIAVVVAVIVLFLFKGQDFPWRLKTYTPGLL